VKKSGLRKRSNMKIRPAQENVKDQVAGTVEFDRPTYQEDAFYPRRLVDESKPLYMDGYRVICLHVRPMQYNPVKQLLHCYSQIDITVTFSEHAVGRDDRSDRDETDLWTYLDHRHNLEGFGNLLFNPERHYFTKAGLHPPSVASAGPRPDLPAFLVIYADAFEKPARRLQTWKQKCGLDTGCVPVSKILKKTGRRNARRKQVNAIKAYIRERRGRPWSPLRYVLLLGDVNTIPTEERVLSGTAEAPLSDTTDFYYFTHRDPRGRECLLPWVAGGRIAARNEEEALAVVDQILRYERHPPDDPDYFARMTVAAYFEDRDKRGRQDGRANQAYMKTMETIRDHMISHGFEVNRVYVTNNRNPERYSDGTPVPLKVKEELIYKTNGALATKKLIGLINQGQLIMGHRGHGDHQGWMDPPLRSDDLTKVASSTPSVFFSINCRCGSFDSGRECFAEEVLALNGGAPSLIASTELSGTWRNDSMIKALFDAIWPGVIATYPVTTMQFPVKHCRMGDVLTYAKAYLLVAHGVNAHTRKHLEIYHVVGDPTLHIWGSEPLPLRLRARIKKDLLVVNMNTCPQEAVLTVWFEEERLLKLAPADTRLAIPLRLLTELPEDALSTTRDHTYRLSLYFSAPGHRVAESQLWF